MFALPDLILFRLACVAAGDLPDGQNQLNFSGHSFACRARKASKMRARKTNFVSRFKPIRVVSSPCAKISLSENQKLCILPLSHPSEGRLENVTDAGWDAVDADSDARRATRDADGEIVWSWRSEAGAKVAGYVPRTTVATKRWSPGRSRFCCTRGRGCTGHPVFPAPSDLLRDVFQAQLGRLAPREGGVVSRNRRGL
jgi:hypothetical protein